MNLKDIINHRIIILDGGMGTLVSEYGLVTGNTDELNLSQPELVRDIHLRYLRAGADIITTNTFSSQRISQADYNLQDRAYDLAFLGAQIAKQAVNQYLDEERKQGRDTMAWVAGDVGPTNKTASLSPDVNDPAARDITYDELFDAYSEEIQGLIDGGADIILIETIFDTLNCKAAIDAAQTVMKIKHLQLPIMVSVTVSDMSGRTLSGQTLEAFLSTLSSYDIFSVGLNCGLGAAAMKPFLKQLSDRAPYYISAHPNAGLPNELGQYNESAESMSPQILEYFDEGLVNIIGGCCGTTDEFIRSYKNMSRGYKPHQPKPRYRQLHLAGLESFVPQPNTFSNVGERCNVAGSRKFLRLINEKNYEEALQIAKKQVEDGALVLDVNMDDGLLDAENEMVTFVNLIAAEPDIAAVPLMIDSSKWEVVEAALRCVQGKCIVNSISLKEGEDKFLSHAATIKRFGAAVVVMCFDEVGQATTYERRIEIAGRAYKLLTEKAGLNPLDIIFDPNVLSIATGMPEHDNYGVEFIQATEWIRTNCPGAHVSGGVSTLSFSFRGNNYIRAAKQAVYLYHAIQKGMDFGIVNPATKVTYSDIPQQLLQLLEDVVLNRRPGASEELIEKAGEFIVDKNAPKETKLDAWREGSVEERLIYALRKGEGKYIEQDVNEALTKYPKAVDIIEGPLMDAMNQVGLRFGEGKMFLPQVGKTARTMKQAGAVLQPVIEAQKGDGADSNQSSGKIVIATVKGDVHDIGKNIVSVVMACNNFNMYDLGVMVPTDEVVQTAIKVNADLVCLSGLITPSLDEMVRVAQEMQRCGLTIPLIVGGATTSALHEALKKPPEYRGTVIWSKDAAMNVVVATKLLNPKERDKYSAEINARYEELRNNYKKKENKLVSISEARDKKQKLWD